MYAWLTSAAPQIHIYLRLLTLFPCPLPHSTEGAHAGFRYFWMTDSCPTARDVMNRAPFEVLSLAAPIAAALQI